MFNHRSRAHTKDFLKKISIIEEGGSNQDLPKTQRFSENYYSQAYAPAAPARHCWHHHNVFRQSRIRPVHALS